MSLWSLALIGRYVSDALLFFSVSSAMFVISYFCWDHKEREAAHLAEEDNKEREALAEEEDKGWSES